MTDASLGALLSAGLQSLNLPCPLEVQARLLDYVRLLHKWNRVYNLTAVRDPAQMVTRHVLDSLAVAPLLDEVLADKADKAGNGRILDVGAGAGLPGIPLALLGAGPYPRREFVLLDSNSKKTRFMRQAVTELGLEQVRVVHERTETFDAGQGFDVVISRAFAAIGDMLSGAGRHCKPGGLIMAMKGEYPATELDDVPAGFELEAVHALQVPGLNEARHLVCLRRVNN